MTELRWPVDAEREREPDVNMLFRMIRKHDAAGLELWPFGARVKRPVGTAPARQTDELRLMYAMGPF